MSSKPPPNLRQAESASALSEYRLGDERHVTHKVCTVITRGQNGIEPVAVRTHVKYFDHRVMSTTALAFSSDLSITPSRQPTSCLIRFATCISYSLIAVDENARFHGLRCCKCNMGSRCATSIGGPSRPSQPDYYEFQTGNVRGAIYSRGPLGRPPCPSTEGMSEESRIESSFGPVS